MGSLNTSSAALLVLALSGCVVPVVDKIEASPPTCKTATQSMSLQIVKENAFLHGGCGDETCLSAALAIFAGSAIISGSIVLTNNTVHWLEYHGSCSDGYLNTAKQHFLDSLEDPTPISTN